MDDPVDVSESLGLPCVRVSYNEWHAPKGTLILYLACKQLRGLLYEWKLLNLETGEVQVRQSGGWQPRRYLNECSDPLRL